MQPGFVSEELLMPKTVFRFVLLLTALVFLTTCTTSRSETISPIATVFESPVPSVNLTAFASPIPTQTPLPLPTSTPASTPTPLAQVPIATEWLTYTHESGVTIQYPANWQIRSNPTYGQVVFGIQLDEAFIPNYRVVLDVYHRPLKDRAIANPYTWQPNEGGYEVHWAKPISVDEASGLEFVWGGYYEHKWDTQPTLNAIYYSERYELDVRLVTSIDDRSIELIETDGFTDTIASRFGVFEHMMKSLEIKLAATM
jgi:hypothetical protein